MSTIARNPGVLHATVGDDLILLSADTLAYFEFNDVGVAIWEMLDDGPVTSEAIVEQLMVEYEVDEDRCRSAVAAFIDKASEKGLLAVAAS